MLQSARSTIRSLLPETGELLHLDVLRIVASVAIVFHHSKEYFFNQSLKSAVYERTAGLALFVDLFFVISGFVIAYVYASRLTDLGAYAHFMKKRVARLFPLHVITLAAMMGIWVVIGLAHLPANNPPSFAASCVLPTLFLLHSFIKCGANYFNGVSWSISAEMVMYAFFPVIAWIGRKSTVTLCAIVVGAMLLDVEDVARGSIWFGALDWEDLAGPLRALPSFAFGCLLFYGRHRLPSLFRPDILLGLCCTALVVTMVFPSPMIVMLALVYLTATLPVICDEQVSAGDWVRRIAPFGQFTFSIYMWHALIILLSMNAMHSVFHVQGLAMLPIAAVCYAAVAIVAYVSFMYVETPLRKLVDSLGTAFSPFAKLDYVEISTEGLHDILFMAQSTNASGRATSSSDLRSAAKPHFHITPAASSISAAPKR